MLDDEEDDEMLPKRKSDIPVMISEEINRSRSQ